MSSSAEREPSTHNDRARVEETLEQLDPYICALVRERIRQYPDIARPEVLDLEADELIQRVRIKFWHMLEEKPINYPRAYIKRIVHSEFIDMTRRLKPVQPLSVDQEGEIYRGNVLVTPGEEMADPADVVERRYQAASRVQETVRAVLRLPGRQQCAMLCSLRERVDDLEQFERALSIHHIDSKAWQWPGEKRQKQLLQASLPYARRNVALHMKDSVYLHAAFMAYKKQRKARAIAKNG